MCPGELFDGLIIANGAWTTIGCLAVSRSDVRRLRFINGRLAWVMSKVASTLL
jgi:hypothetical protein